MKSTSIDTGALLVVVMMTVMIFSPERARVPSEGRESERPWCLQRVNVRNRSKQSKIKDLPSLAKLKMIFATKTKSPRGRYHQ